jgi:hypothetical protein
MAAERRDGEKNKVIGGERRETKTEKGNLALCEGLVLLPSTSTKNPIPLAPPGPQSSSTEEDIVRYAPSAPKSRPLSAFAFFLLVGNPVSLPWIA